MLEHFDSVESSGFFTQFLSSRAMFSVLEAYTAAPGGESPEEMVFSDDKASWRACLAVMMSS